MKICKKCLQIDTRPGIYFDKNGICGACLWNEEMKTIDWEKRRNELKEISDWAKKNSKGNFDCIIGVSGGKDSTFQAITARDELGLRCLLVNSEPEGITEIGKQNIENLKQNGFDVISLRPNPKVMKKLIKRDFFKYLNPIKPTEFPLWASSYIIAEKFEIPLIIQGENPGLTLGVSLTGLKKNSDAFNILESDTLSTGWKDYQDMEGVSEEDLYLFHFNREKMVNKGHRSIWIQYFLKEWSQDENAKFSKKYGMKWREDFNPEDIGTYKPYFQLDTDLTQVNQLLKYIKFGFGQCVDHVCYDIRENKMTRKEGIDMIKRYDGKCSEKYIRKFCDYIGIPLEEFWNTTEKFRGPMWKKDEKGMWKNEMWALLE